MPHEFSQADAGIPALIDAPGAWNDESLGALCERHWHYLLLVAGDSLGSHLQAKIGASDIVQQSLLEAHQAIGQFRGQGDRQLRSWLAQIVRRNVVDQARRYRETQARNSAREVSWTIRAQTSLPVRDETPSVLVRQAEADRELLAAIAQLAPRHQQVIEWRHRDGLPYAEIAQRLGVSPEAARKLWERAIRRLQRILGAVDGQRRPRCD